MLRAYIRDMDVVPEGQLLDMPFGDVMADDVGSAQKVLEFAGPALDARERRRHAARTWTAIRAARTAGSSTTLPATSTWTSAALRERFRFYTDAFPSSCEVKWIDASRNAIRPSR